MTHMQRLTYAQSKTPKAAAIAGILFAVLLFVVFWLLRRSVPADPHEPGSWLSRDSEAVALALNLVPFAGIAFLWFIGVLRDRLGKAEDQFFATVFFGSGVLYLCMLFSAAAVIGALILAFAAQPEEFIDSATFHFARAAAYNIVNIYLTKMASVFMITTSTVAIYTGLTPRGFCRLWNVGAFIVRQLLFRLGVRRFPAMGVNNERSYSDRQRSQTPRLRDAASRRGIDLGVIARWRMRGCHARRRELLGI
jgi:hypothetical protein